MPGTEGMGVAGAGVDVCTVTELLEITTLRRSGSMIEPGGGEAGHSVPASASGLAWMGLAGGDLRRQCRCSSSSGCVSECRPRITRNTRA